MRTSTVEVNGRIVRSQREDLPHRARRRFTLLFETGLSAVREFLADMPETALRAVPSPIPSFLQQKPTEAPVSGRAAILAPSISTRGRPSRGSC